MMRILISVVLVLASFQSLAADPWHALLGYWGGMTREEAKARGVSNCSARKLIGQPEGAVTCDLPVVGKTFAGRSVKDARIVFPPPHDKAAQVQLVVVGAGMLDTGWFKDLDAAYGERKHYDGETSTAEWHRSGAEAVAAQAIRGSVYVSSAFNPRAGKSRADRGVKDKAAADRNAAALKKF